MKINYLYNVGSFDQTLSKFLGDNYYASIFSAKSSIIKQLFIISGDEPIETFTSKLSTWFVQESIEKYYSACLMLNSFMTKCLFEIVALLHSTFVSKIENLSH